MPKILVVEDNKDMRFLFTLMLKGFLIFEAGNGLEAIKVRKNQSIDLILMDILMPEMDGIEATKRIIELWPDSVIVGVTAYSTRAQDLLDAGAKEVLVKPVKKEELIGKIDEYLK